MFGLGKSKEETPLDGLPIYMAEVECAELMAIVASVRPQEVLEWGAGGSTRALLERFSFIENYVAIEHNREWYEKVRGAISDPRLDLHLCPPDQPLEGEHPTREERIAWDARAEVDLDLMRSYVELPTTLGKNFDFVLVDGRARSLCMPVGYALLNTGGVLVVHDAQREEYHTAIRTLGNPIFLEPWEAGQICVVKKA